MSWRCFISMFFLFFIERFTIVNKTNNNNNIGKWSSSILLNILFYFFPLILSNNTKTSSLTFIYLHSGGGCKSHSTKFLLLMSDATTNLSPSTSSPLNHRSMLSDTRSRQDGTSTSVSSTGWPKSSVTWRLAPECIRSTTITCYVFEDVKQKLYTFILQIIISLLNKVVL